MSKEPKTAKGRNRKMATGDGRRNTMSEQMNKGIKTLREEQNKALKKLVK